MQQRYMLAGLGLKSPETRRATGFDGFLAALEKETLAFHGPVVYVHGDSHLFRIDKPLVDSASRRVIENFTRVETFGHPYAHWGAWDFGSGGSGGLHLPGAGGPREPRRSLSRAPSSWNGC